MTAPTTSPRRPPAHEQERFTLGPFPHAQVTATTTVKLWRAPRAFRITGCQYLNVTGLAEDATHAFKGELKNGSDVVAAIFNTDSDGAGDNTLAANTHVVGVVDETLAAGSAGDVITLVLTEGAGATATLPAGEVIFEGYYL